MKKWLARLRGNAFDLEDLSRLFNSDNLKVEKSEDNYYLKCSDFNSLDEPDEVLKIAERTLNLINGVAKIHIGNFQSVSADAITLIDESGKKKNFVFLSGSVTARTRTSLASLKVTNSDGQETDQAAPVFESWISLAKQNELVERVLISYANLTPNWRNLFIILEIIEDDVGGESALISKGWASGNMIKLFKRTANSYIAIGRQARHGSSKKQAPPKPIGLEEAQSLIRNVLVKWLSYKSK